MEDQIEFLQKLIQTRSLSGEEKSVGKLIKGKMNQQNYDLVKTDQLGNVIGVIGDGTPQLMFEAHMDTVGAGNESNWELDPFSGEIRDGKVYGRGSVDMKGPLSSMIFGAARAGDSIKKYRGSLAVACVVHEETMEGAAIEGLIDREGQPDMVVLGEPSGLDVCIGHRGRGVVDLEVAGKTAHASMPQLGKNAALDLIDSINSIRDKELATDPELGDETMALVNIFCKPGGGPVVPDEATARLDFRIGRQTTKKGLIRYVQEAVDELTDVTGKAEIPEKTLQCYTGKDLTYQYFFPAWYSRDEEILSKVRKATNFLPDVEVRTWDFSTDGIYTAGKAKIPTLGFGPGDETQAHQPNERISIEELQLATEGYERVIDEFLGYG
ncbi:MAG: YgeY family selenium metabolism-linked hydrolase [Candidatus Bipolaricaulota bacterium]|nr:YgeY family selenium metabolism-linked hydrolase [Candidatus Bipolaricaulota bacterium]MBS3791994.1 YgeY family selenium metabolism-linked hydrolase [Candidatus Bipolaricaulota bacterium]